MFSEICVTLDPREPLLELESTESKSCTVRYLLIFKLIMNYDKIMFLEKLVCTSLENSLKKNQVLIVLCISYTIIMSYLKFLVAASAYCVLSMPRLNIKLVSFKVCLYIEV